MHGLRSVRAVLPLVVCAALSACQAFQPEGGGGPRDAEVRKLGERYRFSRGDVYLIRVQDEYRLIRCTNPTATGTLAGCYEDVFQLPRDKLTDQTGAEGRIRWNTWVPVPQMPGLQIMFLGPDKIALQEVPTELPR